MYLAELTIVASTSWVTSPMIRWPLTAFYIAVLLLICIYGLHRYWLVLLFYKSRKNQPQINNLFTDLPRITVQLPMFNEKYVTKRIIEAACKLDYPTDLLQIQVVDDSTDESAQIAQNQVDYWTKQGINIQYLHRADRQGFKAGALRDAMPHATGEFFAIFDADFIPASDFLKKTIHYFTDTAIGMVQTRWGHINREDSILTRTQAVFLDAHFLIEHAARSQSNRWINFNGTAGIWRRQAIESAGGWQSDTLTEDMDLSYRSQLAGWRFIFLPHVICPAELPPEMNAFKSQQHRWTKGSIQVAKKLLPSLLRAKISWAIKIEAFFHLTGMTVSVYVTLMVLLLFPAFFVNMQPFQSNTIPAMLWAMSILAMGTASAGTFYIASQKVQNRSVFRTILQLPVLMSIGVGIAVNNTRAVLEALVGHQSPFVRTPKYNQTQHATPIAIASSKIWLSLLEISFGIYTLSCCVIALTNNHALMSIPFLLLFSIGYFYVGIASLWGQFRARKITPKKIAPNPA